MSSVLWRISSQENIFIKHKIIRNAYVFYSRRSNSKNSDSHYKVVKSKVRLDGTCAVLCIFINLFFFVCYKLRRKFMTYDT